MRVLKMVGIGLAALIALILVAGIFLPKRSDSVNSIIINAPKAVIWEQIKSLKNHNNWSPWVEKDPNMKAIFEGTDGNIGSKSSWKGDIIGVGAQTIVAMEDMKSVKVDLKFKEPFESSADALLMLTDQTDGSIKVDWTFGMNMPYPFNALAPIMGDNGVGDDFKHGLEKLKKICESQPAIAQ